MNWRRFVRGHVFIIWLFMVFIPFTGLWVWIVEAFIDVDEYHPLLAYLIYLGPVAVLLCITCPISDAIERNLSPRKSLTVHGSTLRQITKGWGHSNMVRLAFLSRPTEEGKVIYYNTRKVKGVMLSPDQYIECISNQRRRSNALGVLINIIFLISPLMLFAPFLAAAVCIFFLFGKILPGMDVEYLHRQYGARIIEEGCPTPASYKRVSDLSEWLDRDLDVFTIFGRCLLLLFCLVAVWMGNEGLVKDLGFGFIEFVVLINTFNFDQALENLGFIRYFALLLITIFSPGAVVTILKLRTLVLHLKRHGGRLTFKDLVPHIDELDEILSNAKKS